MIRKVLNVATVTAILAASAGTAFAAVDESTINTQTATLNFGATQQVQHTLTPVENLPTDLASLTVLANGHITSNDGTTSEQFAMKYSTLPTIVVGTTPAHATISGDTDSDNKLKVVFNSPDLTADDTTWYYGATAVSSIDYKVEADGQQNVKTDNYTVSIDAGIWTN